MQPSCVPGKGLPEGGPEREWSLVGTVLGSAGVHFPAFRSLGSFNEMFSIPGRKTISLQNIKSIAECCNEN